MHVDISYDALW